MTAEDMKGQPELEQEGHHDLNCIFDEACRVTAPLFDTRLGLGGHSLATSAHRRLRETYSDLTQQEVALLFSAVRRFHRGAG